MLLRKIALITTVILMPGSGAFAQSDDSKDGGETLSIFDTLDKQRQDRDAREAVLREQWATRPPLSQADVNLMLKAHPVIQASIEEMNPPETEEIAKVMAEGTSDVVPFSALAKALAGTEFMPKLNSVAADLGYADYMAYATTVDHMKQISFSQWIVAYSHSIRNFGKPAEDLVADLPALIADPAEDQGVRDTLSEQLAEISARYVIRAENAAVYNANHAQLEALFGE